MTRWLPWLALVAACRHGGHDPDEAPKDPAEAAVACCLAAKWWEAAEDGWGSPRRETLTLAPGEHKLFPVTLTKNLHFRFEACGDVAVTEVDLLLYDSKGEVLVQDGMPGREPRMTWFETERATRKVAVYLRETSTGGPATVSWLWGSQTEE